MGDREPAAAVVETLQEQQPSDGVEKLAHLLHHHHNGPQEEEKEVRIFCCC
jgi:hypothetical protein